MVSGPMMRILGLNYKHGMGIIVQAHAAYVMVGPIIIINRTMVQVN